MESSCSPSESQVSVPSFMENGRFTFERGSSVTTGFTIDVKLESYSNNLMWCRN